MTRSEILSMAREAGFMPTVLNHWPAELERFAALVAAAEREATLAKSNASWKLMCQKMLADEREACAKVCEAWAADHAAPGECTYENCDFVAAAHDCAEAIRARSKK